MQPSYHITSAGVQHAFASPASATDDFSHLLLLYILKNANEGPVLFSDILKYFHNNKSLTFKIISHMISLQLIDMNESEINEKQNATININLSANSDCDNNQYILADLNGLPISCCGFNQQQTNNISAVAYDYIKAAKRSRYETEDHPTATPLSIKTTWNKFDIIIYVLYINHFTCLLITKNDDFINKNKFINLASHLCNRYNYE